MDTKLKLRIENWRGRTGVAFQYFTSPLKTGTPKEQDDRLHLEQERTAMGARLKECNEAVLSAERETGQLEQRMNTGGMEEKQILDKLWESYELSHSAAMEQRIELESTAKANRRIG